MKTISRMFSAALCFSLFFILFFLSMFAAPRTVSAQSVLGQYPTTGQVLVGVTGSVPLFTGTPAMSAVALIPNTAYSAVQISTSFSPVNTSFLVINGTGTLTMTSTPTISTTTAISGQELIITGGANPVTFTDNGTLSGSLLELGAGTRVVSTNKILKLRFYGGSWLEESYASN
jgi:hypothetical protein